MIIPSLQYGTILAVLFEAVLFLIYSNPFLKNKKKRTFPVKYALFCILLVTAKYLWATNDLFNLLIMLGCCSLYFLLFCDMAPGSVIAHSCVFAAMINLSRSMLYSTLRILYGDALFGTYSWQLRIALFAIKALSVFICRRYILRLDKQTRMNPIDLILALNPFWFMTADYFAIMRNETLLAADPRGLAVIHALLCLASILSVIAFFMNLSRENSREYIANLEAAMRETYTRARDKEANDIEIKRLTHDIHHYLAALDSSDGNTGRNIHELLAKVERYERVAYSGNSVLDAILNEKKKQADAASVRLEYFLDQIDYSFLDSMDLCSIFGNALENAIEAAQKVENPGNRWVSVKASVMRGVWILHVDNSYQIEPVMNNNRFISTKSDSGLHGIGISSIRYCANKYGGKVQITANKKIFTIHVMIPVNGVPGFD